MRQVNIKELNKHLSAEMKDLPFAVTKRSKVIGVMIALGTTQGTDLTLEDITPETKGTDIKKKVLTTPKKEFETERKPIPYEILVFIS